MTTTKQPDGTTSDGVERFDQLLTHNTFEERHTRVIKAPISTVWPQCLQVTAADIRLLGPLLALRGLPARLTGRPAPAASIPKPLLDVFAAEGFVVLRRDTAPSNGHASLVFGAVGRFWSVTGNSPIRFDSSTEFLAFADPGWAKFVTRLDAWDLGNGTTRIETETLVTGTDPISIKRFGRYWRFIRLPSGAIRHSWLAAIKRRVKRGAPVAPGA